MKFLLQDQLQIAAQQAELEASVQASPFVATGRDGFLDRGAGCFEKHHSTGFPRGGLSGPLAFSLAAAGMPKIPVSRHPDRPRCAAL